MGSVFRARDRESGGVVAVKDMPLVHPDAKGTELAHREATALRQLDHPALPAAIESIAERGRLYLVQEFIRGRTLAEELVDRRYDQDDVLAIVEEILSILSYLHGRSPPVVRRDLKPGNVMRRADGSLALVDFGSVRDALRDPQLGGRTVAGTFGYMAPEQLPGDAYPATDVYGLGVLAIALLSRRDPAPLMDWSGALRWKDVVSVHPAVEALLVRMLEPDPERRVGDTDALRDEVATLRRDLRAGTALVAKPPGAPTANLSRLAVLAAVVVLMLAGLAAGILSASTDAPAPDKAGEWIPPAEVRVVSEPEPPAVAEPQPDLVSVPAEPGGVVTSPDGLLIPVLGSSELESLALGHLDGMRTAVHAYYAAFDENPRGLEEAGREPEPDAALYFAFQMDWDASLPLVAVITRGPERGRGFGADMDGEKKEVNRLDEGAVLELLALPGVVGNADAWLPSVEVEEPAVAIEDGQLVAQLSESEVLGCVYDELRGLAEAERGYDAAFDLYSEDLERLGFRPDPHCSSWVELGARIVSDPDGPAETVRLGAMVTRGSLKGRRGRFASSTDSGGFAGSPGTSSGRIQGIQGGVREAQVPLSGLTRRHGNKRSCRA
ncbi:MAG: serine/threonine protein kinase [Proteobacteria bacterium]|nr:serine/threonine protein kinase [Pseudomonadota bacterium]